MAKKILVVEDEPASLKVLRYFLGDAGYEIEGAKDGIEALELLAQSHFDLVLSDVKMPRLSGVALARHLRSNMPITRIVLMTAYDFDSREDILELNVPCLSKPLSLDNLLSEVQKVLEKER
jgi:two-component system, cell cycle response regulator CpdR